MQTQVRVRDELVFQVGRPPVEFVLGFPEMSVTAREIIRTRVYQEVDDYNRRRPDEYQGLVQPGDAERTLNGFRMRTPRPLDPAQQYARALEAFARNGFILLVDDRQVEDLDAVVELGAETTVTFLKLVPLVGG